MFGTFLLDQGIELDIDREVGDLLRVLEEEAATFSHEGYGYKLSIGKVVLGSQWQLLVHPVDLKTGAMVNTAIGYILIQQKEDGVLDFQIPPRYEWRTLDALNFDTEGNYFTSFLLKLLSALQKRNLLDLPWPLPVA